MLQAITSSEYELELVIVRFKVAEESQPKEFKVE